LSTDKSAHAEGVLKLLAAAAGTARLYPPASALPKEAVQKLVDNLAKPANARPLYFTVEPQRIYAEGAPVTPNSSPTLAVAEALHAMQVEQFIITPGVSFAEAEAFVALINADPTHVRTGGGARTYLGKTNVQHIAVHEIRLSDSKKATLFGIDLANASLGDIAEFICEATARWKSEVAALDAPDEIASALAKMEGATRELATQRIISALLSLDEKTRVNLLETALNNDTRSTGASNKRMDGMLSVIADMSPTSLARLLTLASLSSGRAPKDIASEIPLSNETLQALDFLFSSEQASRNNTPDEAGMNGNGNRDVGGLDTGQAVAIAAEIAEERPAEDLERQVSELQASDSAARALATITAISHKSPDAETLRAIGEALPEAVRIGAFTTVHKALRRLDELGENAALADEVDSARSALALSDVLTDMCDTVKTASDAVIAGKILSTAGNIGAETLLMSYTNMPRYRRLLMGPVLGSMSGLLLGAARAHLQSANPEEAVEILHTLVVLNDRRAAGVIAQALNSNPSEKVRFAAATALADMPVAEAHQSLVRALNQQEAETRQHIVREVGRKKICAAAPVLIRLFNDTGAAAKNYGFRKEIIVALASIDSPDAQKALKKFAKKIAFTKKNRDLRHLAQNAVTLTPDEERMPSE